MKEELIQLETAKLAKVKGFDEYCMNSFDPEGYEINEMLSDGSKNSEWMNDTCTRPTQSFLQKWLRQKHKLHIEITIGSETEFAVICGTLDNPDWIREEGGEEDVMFFSSYEEALEAGLIKVLNLI